jgi:hypothetical protein
VAGRCRRLFMRAERCGKRHIIERRMDECIVKEAMVRRAP